MGTPSAGPILPGAAVVGSLPPHVSSKVPLREPVSTCICSLFKTASSFDLWYCANVMSVIKGQYMLNQRITLWFPSKVQGSKGVWQPLQHRAKRAFRQYLSQNLLYHYFVEQCYFIFRCCFTWLFTEGYHPPLHLHPPPCLSAPRDSSKACSTRDPSWKLYW